MGFNKTVNIVLEVRLTCVVVDVVGMTVEVLGVVEVIKVVKEEDEEDVREGIDVVAEGVLVGDAFGVKRHVQDWATEGIVEDKGVLVDVTETVVATGESTVEVGVGAMSLESTLKSALRRSGPCRWTRPTR